MTVVIEGKDETGMKTGTEFAVDFFIIERKITQALSSLKVHFPDVDLMH